jgi:hypothetical protein
MTTRLMATTFGVGWTSIASFRSTPSSKVLPTRDDHLPFTPEQVGDVWSDLEDLHKLGILVRDIKIGN